MSADARPLRAKDKFSRGDEVQLSAAWRGHHGDKDKRRRTVVGCGREGTSVRIRIEGLSEIQSWHIDFIEKVHK